MATRADVARLAGVSQSTVSYVLSGARPISAETRERVLAAMLELSYTPNVVAAGLAGRRTGIFALHFPVRERGLSVTDFEYIFAATEQARSSNHHLLIWTNAVDEVEELRLLAKQGLVDGVILMEVELDDPRPAVLRDTGVPFVLIGRTADPTGAPFVDSDFDRMAGAAVEHLAGLGHVSLALAGQGAEDLAASYGPMVRLRAALLAETGARGIRLATIEARPTIAAGRAAFGRLGELAERPTAVLSFSEQTIVGVVEAAVATGLRLPQDLSVLCLGVSPATAEITTPALTTVSPPGPELGRRAMRLLIDVAAGRVPEQDHILLEPTLFVRGSTGPARP